MVLESGIDWNGGGAGWTCRKDSGGVTGVTFGHVGGGGRRSAEAEARPSDERANGESSDLKSGFKPNYEESQINNRGQRLTDKTM